MLVRTRLAATDDDGKGAPGTGTMEGDTNGARLAADTSRTDAPPAAAARATTGAGAGAAEEALDAAALFGPAACF